MIFSNLKTKFFQIIQKLSTSDISRPYIYLFIRTDIPIAQQIVQSSHVAWQSGQENHNFKDTPSLILIGVSSAVELSEIGGYLNDNKIAFTTFYEPDYNMGNSAICTDPICRHSTRALLKDYKLWVPKE